MVGSLMLKTSSKIVSACALTSLLAGCTWYTQLADTTAHREARSGQYEAEPEQRYLRRFDALQQRIEALERENYRLRSPKASRSGTSSRYNNAVSTITPHKVAEPEADKQNDVIAQVKLKVSEAVLAIDNVLSQLTAMPATVKSAEVTEPHSVVENNVTPDVAEQEAELVASLTRPTGAVNGSVVPNTEGELVDTTRSTAQHQARA